jgi:hypothetical protein
MYCQRLSILIVLCWSLFCPAKLLAHPTHWQTSVIGGGGTFFSPCIGPYNSSEIWMTSFGKGQELVDSYDIYIDVEVVKLSLYPNPASDFIQVRLDIGADYVSTLSLLDINGRVLKEKIWKLIKGPNAIQLPLDKYPTGRYEVILWLEGEVYTKSFIKK